MNVYSVYNVSFPLALLHHLAISIHVYIFVSVSVCIFIPVSVSASVSVAVSASVSIPASVCVSVSVFVAVSISFVVRRRPRVLKVFYETNDERRCFSAQVWGVGASSRIPKV